MTTWLNRCHFGDVRDVLRQMAAAGVKVNCIVTSPPYWGLRSYLPEGHPDKPREIGSEPTLGEFIATLTEVFDLAREVLADDGTCFVNMGDAYAGSWGAQGRQGEGGQVAGRSACAERQIAAAQRRKSNTGSLDRAEGLKNKDLMGQPWRLAFALQDAGWWLRQEIIWSKPNPMPESVRDRCTKAHEHIFLLTKAERYYWNFEGSQEPVSGGANPRRPGNGVGFGHGYDPVTKPRAVKTPAGWATGTDLAHDEVLGRYTEHRKLPGNVNPPRGQQAYLDGDEKHRTKGGLLAYARKLAEPGSGTKNNTSMDAALSVMPLVRNPRSVWTIPTQSYSGSHFATFPEALVERCLIPGCPPGGTVLDIFLGSGTTAQVAQRLGMNWIGIDLDLRNEALQRDRIGGQAALILEQAA